MAISGRVPWNKPITFISRSLLSSSKVLRNHNPFGSGSLLRQRLHGLANMESSKVPFLSNEFVDLNHYHIQYRRDSKLFNAACAAFGFASSRPGDGRGGRRRRRGQGGGPARESERPFGPSGAADSSHAAQARGKWRAAQKDLFWLFSAPEGRLNGGREMAGSVAPPGLRRKRRR